MNNKVQNFETIKVMNTMRNLHLIDLSDNPICSSKDYRKNFFDNFPKLIFLDGISKNNETYQEFEENEDNEEEEEEENEEDKNFLDDYEEEKEEEEEEEEEIISNGVSNNNNNNYEGNIYEVDNEEEEEIENFQINLGKRKKYR